MNTASSYSKMGNVHLENVNCGNLLWIFIESFKQIMANTLNSSSKKKIRIE